jgi:hypothetical protein
LLRPLLRSVIGCVREEGADAAIFRVPGDQPTVLAMLQQAAFRISHSDVRMTYADLPVRDRPGTIHLSKWE